MDYLRTTFEAGQFNNQPSALDGKIHFTCLNEEVLSPKRPQSKQFGRKFHYIKVFKTSCFYGK